MNVPDFLNTNFYKSFLTRGHQRTIRAKKNIGISFISKAVSILISFLIVPLTLSYVGKVEYGIWMTLSSIIHWFTFFDIGLGNGLRNKLAEALARDDKTAARIYVSSAFALISVIALFMLFGFLIISHFISWGKVFNTEITLNKELLRVVRMVFFLFCIGFIFKILSSILQAIQRYGIDNIIGIIAQLVGLGGIFILVKTTEGSLFNMCIVYAGKTPVIMLLASILLFSGPLRDFSPRIAYIQIRKAIPLINLGIKFFLNQIFYLIVTQSSLILVAQFFGPADVTVYNLAVRYMTIGTMIYMMILTPFLTAFTEAYTKKEFNWISLTINRINIIWIVTSIITILLIFGYRLFFKLWVGDAIKVPLSLIIALAISGIIHTFYNKYSLFLNGIGKIQLQMYLLGIQAVLFIPLSYLFYRLGFQLVSIVAAQITIYTMMAFFMTAQYKKIMNKTATGIWNK